MNTQKIAQALRLFAEAIEDGEEDAEPKAPKQTRAKSTKSSDSWKFEPLEPKSGDGNPYQTLVAAVGGVNTPFDAFEMAKNRDKNPFKHCSQARLLLELKVLETEKLAVPLDDLRQRWILLKP